MADKQELENKAFKPAKAEKKTYTQKEVQQYASLKGISYSEAKTELLK